jgi:hypothetical protein
MSGDSMLQDAIQAAKNQPICRPDYIAKSHGFIVFLRIPPIFTESLKIIF